MNPLTVSFAAALNFFAMYLIAKFVALHVVTLMPAGPARDGLAALTI